MSLWVYLKAIAAPRRAWALLAVVGLGMLIALMLLSMVPLYTSLIAEAHLQYSLASTVPQVVNVDVQAQSFAIAPEIAAAASTKANALAHTTIGGFTKGPVTYLEAWNSHLNISLVNGADPVRAGVLPAPSNQATVFGFDLGQTGPHIHLFAGRLPRDTAPGQMPEVLVTNQMENIHVGDAITLQIERSADKSVTARVVGIWYPADKRDRFWNGRLFDWTPTPIQDTPVPNVFPLVFTQATFLSALNFGVEQSGSIVLGAVGMLVHSVYFTDGQRITPDRISATMARVKTLRSFVSGTAQQGGVYHMTASTGLDQLLSRVQGQAGLLAQPLATMVAQIVGLALLFVVAMAGVLVDGQAVEMATLKSRGASERQLLIGYGLQGIVLAALVAVPAALLAVVVSIALVSRLIPTPVGTSEYTLDPAYLQVYLTSSISPLSLLLPALLGLAVGAAALLAAAVRTARLDVLALRREQGRSTAIPFWRRFYLDIGVALLCAAGYLELATFGTLGVRQALARPSTAGGASAGPDPFLLAAPGLLLLAGALLVLRLFPYAARLGATVAARERGASGMLAFAQVARGAGGLGRLTLLLTLAVGLGLFAITFQASLAQNARDHAAYRAGSDELVQLAQGGANNALTARYAQLPGVSASMPVYRTAATLPDTNLLNAQVLAVDPTICAQVTYWRSDYADRPLSELMAAMRARTQGPSAGTNAGDPDHPLWVLIDATLAATLHVHAGDSFKLTPQYSSATISYVAGAVINAFPTLFDAGSSGFLIVDIDDYFAAVAASAANDSPPVPTEYWLRTRDEAARAAAEADPSLKVNTLVSRRELIADLESDPLEAGMIGLLLVGATVAAVLALVGSIVQAALSARQRVRLFAILRTLGMSIPQLVRMLLAEQAMVYCFGLAGGTLLGLLLSQVTLPFLQFSSAQTAPDQVGMPPYLLAFDPTGAALFYGMLLVAFVVAPLLAGQFATSLGLGKTLRLGED